MDGSDFEAGAVLLIDKPLEWTSFDVVKKIRGTLQRHLGLKKLKVGHAGTLDPLATGLLIVCTGKKTKLIEQFQAKEKTYEGSFQLGATTPSFDRETEVDGTFDFEHITATEIHQCLSGFLGESTQIAPAFSAKRVNGKKAYEHARKGEEVNIKSHPITIYEAEVKHIALPQIAFKIRCSKGTYIRSIARDFGQKLNNGAYLSSLRRTGIGPYAVDQAIGVDDFSKLFEDPAIKLSPALDWIVN